ncbi:MAG: aspartate aminotransferase family protein [Thermoplasmata archaeon]|nr:aspartate aminotransferase family protein [Thermoplasmata archaeon]
MPSDDRDVVRASNYVTWRRQAGWNPLEIVRGDGSTFYDARGRAYLDFASQMVASNLGHSNTAVIEAAARQMAAIPFVAPGFVTPARAEISRELATVLPPGLTHYFFTTSGTEANEAALKIARVATGRRKVLARTRSYHGSTAASMAVSGDPRRGPSEAVQSVPGTVFVPDCYCYRCPLGLAYPSCHVACADAIEPVIEQEGDVAAMIVEPVVGTNGAIVPVPEYLPRIREITSRHGVLLIADEVMTGWGRLGAWFGVTEFGITPDILTTAKGITGGYLPLGLTATTTALHDAFRDRFFPHGHTYEAHPVLLAAGAAAIREYRRLGLIEKAKADGAYLLGRLRELVARHPSVGVVRGLGLLCAVELVRDRATKAPFNTEAEKIAGAPLVADAVAAAMMAQGVYVMPWVSHLILAPPLIVTRAEIDQGVAALDTALAIADAHVAANAAGGGVPTSGV